MRIRQTRVGVWARTIKPIRVSVVMTVEEVARYLKITPQTVCKMARDGEIPGWKFARRWRFHKWALDQWGFRRSIDNLKEEDEKASRAAG